MKITDYATIFFVILVCIVVRSDIRSYEMECLQNKKVQYNNKIDTAVDDAVNELLDYDSAQRTTYQLNKDLCVQKFYQSLYAAFGILDDVSLQVALKSYIPILVITDQDGFYIHYKNIDHTKQGENCFSEQWSERFPYTYHDGTYIYSFTYGSYLSIYEIPSNKRVEGEWSDLREQFPMSQVLSTWDQFEYYRRSSIVNAIEEKMNYYINSYNEIAKQFGISYQFFLPQNMRYEIERSIDDLGLFVFMQNYPYGIHTKDRYNRYSFGGSRLIRNEKYYVSFEGNMGYYHRKSCGRVSNQEVTFDTKLECVKKGYFPCDVCNP